MHKRMPNLTKASPPHTKQQNQALHTYIEPLPLHATGRGALHRYRPFPVVQAAGPRLHAQWNQCQVCVLFMFVWYV